MAGRLFLRPEEVHDPVSLDDDKAQNQPLDTDRDHAEHDIAADQKAPGHTGGQDLHPAPGRSADKIFLLSHPGLGGDIGDDPVGDPRDHEGHTDHEHGRGYAQNLKDLCADRSQLDIVGRLFAQMAHKPEDRHVASDKACETQEKSLVPVVEDPGRNMDGHAGHDDAHDLDGREQDDADHPHDGILAGQIGDDRVPVPLTDQGQKTPEALSECQPDQEDGQKEDAQGRQPSFDPSLPFFYKCLHSPPPEHF